MRHEIEDVARRCLGTPNAKLSTASELRFGTHGSISVIIDGDKAGSWFDHEHRIGGGLREFLERYDRAPPYASHQVTRYAYRDEQGKLLFYVCRGQGKKFWQEQIDSKGKIIRENGKPTMRGARLVLYHLPEIVELKRNRNGHPPRIYLVEGEKDADRLSTWCLLASCNPGGAGKWRDEYSPHLAGCDVVIIPDNDEVGRSHAAQVAASVAPHAERVRVLHLRGLPEKGDVSDWIDKGGDQSTLETLVDDTASWESSGPQPSPQPSSTAAPWLHPEEPLDVIDLSMPAIVEARRWLVPDWLPLGETALFSGEGARGKTTILQQLATASALGRHSNWLGLQVTPLPTLMLLCEDKPNDVLLRQDAINRLYRCQTTDLSGNLVLMPRRGKLRNELGIFDRDGALHRTTFYFQLVNFIKTSGIRLIIIDGRSDVFWGNQNDERHARVFIRQILDSLAAINDGVVVMLMHPSQTGKKDGGGGTSGSVQWQSTGRAFAYLEDRDDDPEDEENGVGGRNRLITLNKGNFAPRDQTIEIRWQDGVFVVPQAPIDSGPERAAKENRATEAVLAIIDRWLAGHKHINAYTADWRIANELDLERHKPKIGKKDVALILRKLTSQGVLAEKTYRQANGASSVELARV